MAWLTASLVEKNAKMRCFTLLNITLLCYCQVSSTPRGSGTYKLYRFLQIGCKLVVNCLCNTILIQKNTSLQLQILFVTNFVTSPGPSSGYAVYLSKPSILCTGKYLPMNLNKNRVGIKRGSGITEFRKRKRG